MKWCPDTCGCEIDLNVDGAGNKTLNSINKCSSHSALPDQEAFERMDEENQCKNYTLAELQKEAPAMEDDDYMWHFDEGRVLHIDVSKQGFSSSKKQGLQNALDTRFGSGKVKVA